MSIQGECDVVIMGGGLAGGTLARQLLLARPNLSIVVLERSEFPLPDAAHKVGESSVEMGAHYFSEMLGLKDYLAKCQLRKFGLRFYLDAPKHRELKERAEFGSSRFLKVPTFQLDRGHMENHLRDLTLEMGVRFIDGAKATECELNESGRHAVEYKKGGETFVLNPHWVVDASGRWSLLKKKLGLAEQVGHAASAAWWRYDAELNMDEWFAEGGDPFGPQEGSRRLSTNHMSGKGYWVWFIPLREGRTSVGIVYDETIHDPKRMRSIESSIEWLEEFEPIAADVCKKHAGTLMDYRVLRKYAHGCARVMSGDRWGMSGEAGVFLDPFYSPGSDFIGIANTMLTDLIVRSTDGEKIVRRAEVYNHVYKSLFANSLLIYEGQYALFGNPVVMPMKIVWDYALYWAFMTPLLMRGVLTDFDALTTLQPFVGKIESLNREMQALFREWDVRSRPSMPQKAIDVSRCPYLMDLNRALSAERFESLGAVQDFMRHASVMLLAASAEMKRMAECEYGALPAEPLSPEGAGLLPFLRHIMEGADARAV